MALCLLAGQLVDVVLAQAPLAAPSGKGACVLDGDVRRLASQAAHGAAQAVTCRSASARWVNQALLEMGELFARMHKGDARGGHPSMGPEKLLLAMLLQGAVLGQLGASAGGAGAIQADRHKRPLHRLIGRWMGGSVWVPTVFIKRCGSLIKHDAVRVFFNGVLKQAEQKR